jgi:hypothetical protein
MASLKKSQRTGKIGTVKVRDVKNCNITSRMEENMKERVGRLQSPVNGKYLTK